MLVARLLRVAAPPGVEVRESTGDACRLLELFEGADRVVLVDAARGPGAPGTAEAVPLDAAQPLPIQSTHGRWALPRHWVWRPNWASCLRWTYLRHLRSRLRARAGDARGCGRDRPSR